MMSWPSAFCYLTETEAERRPRYTLACAPKAMLPAQHIQSHQLASEPVSATPQLLLSLWAYEL